jgi:hypothetical protein
VIEQKNYSKLVSLQGILGLGLLATGFYLIVFKGGITFDFGGNPPQKQIDMTPYEGRSTYYGSDGDPKNYVRGFPMPTDMKEIDWSKGTVEVLLTPDSPIFFESVYPRNAIEISMKGSDKVGYYHPFKKEMTYEHYDDVIDYFVLARNTDLK